MFSTKFPCVLTATVRFCQSACKALLTHANTCNNYLAALCYIILSMHLFPFSYSYVSSMIYEVVCVMTEWLPEHFSDVAVLLSKCEDVYSADVPSSLQVSNHNGLQDL